METPVGDKPSMSRVMLRGFWISFAAGRISNEEDGSVLGMKAHDVARHEEILGACSVKIGRRENRVTYTLSHRPRIRSHM